MKKIKEFDCNDLHFVHACHPEKASKNHKVYKDNILNLCNTFGYHELLGWMSSIILKKSALKKILIDSTQNLYFIDTKDHSASSCFAHSASILKNYHCKKGLFLDYPFSNKPRCKTNYTIQKNDGKKKMLQTGILKLLMTFLI